jgi:NAD(P)H-flavin reductase
LTDAGFLSAGPPLDKGKFKPFVLESMEPVSSNSTMFTLLPATTPDSRQPYEGQFSRGVWSIEVKQPQLQISRAYTPLPPLYGNAEASNPHALRFLIRHDPKGEVSSYVHKLPLGARIELRGPQLEYTPPSDVGEVVFIAGGTGIAPALQVAHALHNGFHKSLQPPPRIRILWANRRKEDCLGSPSGPNARAESFSELRSLSTSGNAPGSDKASMQSELSPVVKHLQYLETMYPDRFSVEYFVDDENTIINEQVVEDSLQITRLNGDEKTSRKKVILVSGPEGFVKYLAGPKHWVGGREVQGELGGLLSRIDHSGWEVWKL